MITEDKTIEHLLDLEGVRYVIDEQLGWWVKFEIRKVKPTKERPHGIKYSLTLHDRTNQRIMGFDNAHPINDSKCAHDHWHRDDTNKAKIYSYINAGKLIEDFWKEVEKMQKQLAEIKK